jgi:hypothetical protein
MKFWIGIIISFFVIACQTPGATQSVKNSRTIKKEEKADIDSLFIVYSLPIKVSYTNNFTQPDIADSLIALLKRKKYKYPDSSAYAQLSKAKLMEIIPMNNIEDMREIIAKRESDKNYYTKKAESADPFAQEIQLSFLTKDSGINYINVRRLNPPNYRKFRDWVFTYPDSEPSNQFAARILDSLINTRGIQ